MGVERGKQADIQTVNQPDPLTCFCFCTVVKKFNIFGNTFISLRVGWKDWYQSHVCVLNVKLVSIPSKRTETLENSLPGSVQSNKKCSNLYKQSKKNPQINLNIVLLFLFCNFIFDMQTDWLQFSHPTLIKNINEHIPWNELLLYCLFGYCVIVIFPAGECGSCVTVCEIQ